MSRLNSMIRRLEAQRDGIEWAARKIVELEGDVIEIGLGNGRTYDHLRECMPQRRIWVIERSPSAHPASTPPEERLITAEADSGLAYLLERGVRAALIHYDLGTGLADQDRALAKSLSPSMAQLLTPGGVAVANNVLDELAPIAGPQSVSPGRYFFYLKPIANA